MSGAGPALPSLALGIILHPRDAGLLPDWLSLHAPIADALLAVVDTDGVDADVTERGVAERDVAHKQVAAAIGALFQTHPQCQGRELRLRNRALSRDFAAQRNACAALCPCDWLLMLDADERLEPAALKLLRPALARVAAERPGLRVLGFPRKNTLDGVPTGVWPDYQFRLVRRGVRWQNSHPELGASPGCHEMPTELQNSPECVALLEAVQILHEKSAAQQRAQNHFYERIADGPGAAATTGERR